MATMKPTIRRPDLHAKQVKSCNRKVGFDSEDRVIKYGRRMQRKGRKFTIGTYKCMVCKKWHLTSVRVRGQAELAPYYYGA